MLKEYEEESLEVLMCADEESSKDVWEVFVNASPELILSYAVKKFGEEEVKSKLNEIIS